MSAEKKQYGSWISSITAEDVAAQITFKEVYLSNGVIYWLEGRPYENGRTVLMCYTSDTGTQELLPPEYGIRSAVHGYGGGALLVVKNGNTGQIFFVRDVDQQIYQFNAGKIRKITDHPTARFADGSIAPDHKSLFYVMEERHPDKVANSIVQIDIGTGSITKIVEGNDFYAQPRVSPCGTKLVFITWNHPHMSWDGCELWELNLKAGTKHLLAGGEDESVVDPQWAPDGSLHFVSDQTGWWNIYRNQRNSPLINEQAEFALPGFFFGRSLYGFSTTDLIASKIENGVHKFGKILDNGACEPLDIPFTSVRTLSVEEQSMVLIAGSPTHATSIVMVNLLNQSYKIIASANKKGIDDSLVPQAQILDFATSEKQRAHAFYYPPTNPHFTGTATAKPPLIVRAHGGPTSQFSLALSLDTIFWTSRGFAVVDVNYRGSTGFGRAYRNSLRNNWGVYDVDDCIAAARHCIEQGWVDSSRLAIEGGSAGGFTTLAALATHDFFHVGANYYGVSNLETLVLETHKFQSHYLFGLLGKYPDKRHIYLERSPLYQADAINKPVIIFQGKQDTIVPPSQSDAIYKSLLQRHIPTAYLLFEDEGHVFAKSPNIIMAIKAQCYFFLKILNIHSEEEQFTLKIDNL